MNKQPFDSQIFINSLPKGSGQREDEFSIVASYGASVGTNLILEYALIVMEELDLDNPSWNPIFTLDEWCVAFGIDDLINDPRYDDDEFRNYIVRFYNRVLLSRPFPISINKLNTLFNEYSELGCRIMFTDTFTFGTNKFGDETSEFGTSNNSSVIIVDTSKRYSAYYLVVIRLLKRVLPIWALITPQIFFSPGENLPKWNRWLLIHDCNNKYYTSSYGNVLATGEFTQSTTVNAIEDLSFHGKKVEVSLQEFRNAFKIFNTHLGFFVKATTSPIMDIKIIFETDTISFTAEKLIIGEWFFIQIPINISIDIMKTANTLVFESEGEFFLDQIKWYVSGEESSKELNLTIEFTYYADSLLSDENEVFRYLDSLDVELSKHELIKYEQVVQIVDTMFPLFGLQFSKSELGLDFGVAEFGEDEFSPTMQIDLDKMASYSNYSINAITIIRKYISCIYLGE